LACIIWFSINWFCCSGFMLENKILIPLTPVHRLSLNIGLNPYPARKFRFVAGTSFLVPSPFSSPFILTPGKRSSRMETGFKVR
jgi:hypothetical protein